MNLIFCRLLIISRLSSLIDVSFNSPLYLIADSRALLQNVPSGYYRSSVYKLGLNSSGYWFSRLEIVWPFHLHLKCKL